MWLIKSSIFQLSKESMMRYGMRPGCWYSY